ncbi:MAG: S-layer homology domain-containing protein [Clostridiales bacterium]|jgi:hypothetical protein|nr:S-layer homology domain-containing protein [Clostridiales bacterium]
MRFRLILLSVCAVLFAGVLSFDGVALAGGYGADDFSSEPEHPLFVNIIEGSAADAYRAKSQIIRYGEIIDPYAVRAYIVSSAVTGDGVYSAVPDGDAVRRSVSGAARSAVAAFVSYGYAASLQKVVSVDSGADGASVLVMVKLAKNGAEFYAPYLEYNGEAVTGYADVMPRSVAGFCADYADLLENVSLSPDYSEPINRGDYVYLLFRALSEAFPDRFSAGLPEALGKPAERFAFADARAPYLDSAKTLGLIVGAGDGNFLPDNPIRRSDAAGIAERLIELLLAEGLADGANIPEVGFSISEFAGFKANLSSEFAGFRANSLDDTPLTKAEAVVFADKIAAFAAPAAASVFARDVSVVWGELPMPGEFFTSSGSAAFDGRVNPAVGANPARLMFTLGGSVPVASSARLYVYGGRRMVDREAGSTAAAVKLEDFLPSPPDGAKLLTDTEYFDYSKAGVSYPVAIKLGSGITTGFVRVVDTTPPTALPNAVAVDRGAVVNPNDFISGLTDVSPVSAAFAGVAPDTSVTGTGTVVISLKDKFGNSSEVISELTVVPGDETPPAFDFIAIKYVPAGTVPDYMAGVFAADDSRGAVRVTVDASGVNTAKQGYYPVVYSASDTKGNISKTTAYVYMTATDPARVWNLADQVLAKIIAPGMTDYEKCRAIYDWVYDHVSYLSDSDKGDAMTAAYNAFAKGRGDCYTYYGASEILLTRAGFKVLRIERVGGSDRHFWNLVDIGDGWRHFDTTRHASDKTVVCLLTQEQLDSLARARGSSYYRFDASVYPKIQ